MEKYTWEIVHRTHQGLNQKGSGKTIGEVRKTIDSMLKMFRQDGRDMCEFRVRIVRSVEEVDARDWALQSEPRLTVRGLIDSLKAYPPELEVCTEFPSGDNYYNIVACQQGFRNPRAVSRGIASENVSATKSERFDEPVLIIELGW